MQQEIEHEEILHQWLKFLLERVGHNNLPRLLDYYESLGWIGMDVSDKLIGLAEAQKQRYVGPSWTLSAEEHRISMLFIEKLQGKPVEVSLLSIGATAARARPEEDARTMTVPREGYLEAHRLEKDELELAVQRREVTIKNLEQELEKRDDEINKLREKVQELEYQLDEYREEIRKDRIYREILEDNIRLRKADLYRK